MKHCKSCGLKPSKPACSCERKSFPLIPYIHFERLQDSRLFLSLLRLLPGIACLILLGASLLFGNGSSFASTSPLLKVSQASFNGNRDCSYGRSAGWTCWETLSRKDRLHKNLSWSAWSSGIPGISFRPANGLLAQGSTVMVSITIPNTVCPASATFTFKGSHTIIHVPWSCPGKRPGKRSGNGTNNSVSLSNLSTGALILNGRDQVLSYRLTLTLTSATARGWHVMITSTQFTSGGLHPHALPVTALSVTGVSIACQSGSCNAANNQVRYPVLVPASNSAPRPVAFYDSAGNNTGIGTFRLVVSLHVQVPGNAYAGTYTSLISIILITGSF